jgi:hypothetical protein
MTRSILLICILLEFCEAAPAYEAGTAGWMQSICADPETVTVCKAWISGFVAGLPAAHHAERNSVSVCLPSPFNGIRGKSVIEGYLARHPKFLSLDMGPVFLMALSDAFPCPPPK